MSQDKIEQGFANAGWGIDRSFYKHLVVGYMKEFSILAYRQAWETDDPEFELCDHENNLVYWVREIPTPEHAAQLLQEHGKPPKEWDQP